MKVRSTTFYICFLAVGLSYSSCNQSSKQDQNSLLPDTTGTNATEKEILLKDYGAEPTVLDIDAYTMSNTNFRTTLWTGGKLQVTLMSIPTGGEVGLEQHPDTDQFLRIEDGSARVMIGSHKDSLDFVKTAEKDFAIFIPAGKWHNIVNSGDRPLKIYSVYSPAEHPHGTIHKTKKDADEAEFHH